MLRAIDNQKYMVGNTQKMYLRLEILVLSALAGPKCVDEKGAVSNRGSFNLT